MIAMFYNANRDSEKDPKGIGWQDVFPEWKEPTKPQTDDEMFDNMKMWALVTGGELPST